MNRNQHIGKVILAGAGPGDPDLITVKALNYLRIADVIIVDRLVCDQLLEDHANKDALILHTGKQRQKENSTPQFIINELLVEYALQGKLVLRLKGGDVSVFSNLLDELKSLTKHNIPYEIIPGITAAAGAAAYAGIPLTAREHANSIRFLTFYKKELLDNNHWHELAQTDDTLVFYMSSDLTDSLVQHLIENKIPGDRYISVIEQATTPFQNVSTCNIHDYAKIGAGKNYMSPTLIIIGKVAGLQEEFAWLPNSHSQENFFKPIEKKATEEVRA